MFSGHETWEHYINGSHVCRSVGRHVQWISLTFQHENCMRTKLVDVPLFWNRSFRNVIWRLRCMHIPMAITNNMLWQWKNVSILLASILWYYESLSKNVWTIFGLTKFRSNGRCTKVNKLIKLWNMGLLIIKHFGNVFDKIKLIEHAFL